MILSRFLQVVTVTMAVSAAMLAQTSTTSPAASASGAAQSGAATQSPSGAQPASSNQATTATTPSQNPRKAEAERERSGADPLLDMPPLPNNPATLVGGTVARLDRIRDHLDLRPFGGGKMDVAFDVRTKIYRNGQPGTVHDLKPGSRVYVDTMLNGDQVFARTIRVQTEPTQGDARGQIVAYDSRHQVLTLREQVSPQPVKLRVTQQTAIQRNGKPGSLSDLQRGALVTVQFEPSSNDRDVARTIHVLATPGSSFIFAGTVTFLDLRARRMAIDNRTDNQNYEIALDSVPDSMIRDLRVGSDATVKAVFDGENYQARTVDVANTTANSNSQQ